MKKIIVSCLSLILILIVGGIVVYYYYPLPAYKLFPKGTHLYEVNFGSYHGENGVQTYEKKLTGKQLDKFQAILASSAYTHAIGGSNILNNGNALRMILLFRNKEGDLDNRLMTVNEKGEIVIGAKFHATTGKKIIFPQLLELLVDDNPK